MSDQTEIVKSSAKIYLEELQKRYDSEAETIPSGVRASFRVAMEAGHNAINGGSSNTESLRVALGAMICANTEAQLALPEQISDVVSQVISERVPELIRDNASAVCPLPKDKHGMPTAEVMKLIDNSGFSIGSKWFNLNFRGKLIAVMGVLLFTLVVMYVSGLWLRHYVFRGVEEAEHIPTERVLK